MGEISDVQFASFWYIFWWGVVLVVVVLVVVVTRVKQSQLLDLSLGLGMEFDKSPSFPILSMKICNSLYPL